MRRDGRTGRAGAGGACATRRRGGIVRRTMDAIELQKQFQRMRAGGGDGRQMADLAEEMAAEAFEGARRSARVVSAVMTVMLGGMSAGAAFGAVSGALGGGQGLAQAAVAGVVSLVLAGFAGLMVRNFLALSPPPRELVASGQPARLTVRDYRSAPGSMQVTDNGSRVNLQRVALDLEVAPDGGAPYTVTVREYLSGRAFVKLAPGAVLAGYVDRADPGRVYIDWRARAGG